MRIDEIHWKPNYDSQRSVPTSREQFLADRSKFSQILSRPPIFRGIANRSDDFLFVNPKAAATPRRSRNATNQYTLMMDNLPAWQAYPKRSQSIICSSAQHQAGGYGTLYRVLPVNGSKLGICPSADLWFSFPMFSKHEFKLNHFVDSLYELYNQIFKDTLSNTDYQTLVTQVNQLDAKLKENPELVRGAWHPEFADMYSKNSHAPLMQTFAEYMDPIANGFRLQTTANYDPVDNRAGSHEVWTDGPSYLVKSDIFNRMEAGREIE